MEETAAAIEARFGPSQRHHGTVSAMSYYDSLAASTLSPRSIFSRLREALVSTHEHTAATNEVPLPAVQGSWWARLVAMFTRVALFFLLLPFLMLSTGKPFLVPSPPSVPIFLRE